MAGFFPPNGSVEAIEPRKTYLLGSSLLLWLLIWGEKIQRSLDSSPLRILRETWILNINRINLEELCLQYRSCLYRSAKLHQKVYDTFKELQSISEQNKADLRIVSSRTGKQARQFVDHPRAAHKNLQWEKGSCWAGDTKAVQEVRV